jgi:hypothetical protein
MRRATHLMRELNAGKRVPVMQGARRAKTALKRGGWRW